MDSFLYSSYLLLLLLSNVSFVKPDVVVLSVNKNELVGVFVANSFVENMTALKHRITTLEGHLNNRTSVASIDRDVIVVKVNNNALVGVLVGKLSIQNLADLKSRITTLESDSNIRSYVPTAKSDVAVLNAKNNALVGSFVGNFSAENLAHLKNRITTMESKLHSKRTTDTTDKPELVLLNINKNAIVGVLVGKISAKNLAHLEYRITHLEHSLNGNNQQITPYVDEIVHYIKRLNFKIAEKKLIEMNDNSRISKIVRRVYSRSENNFKLIVNFSRSLSNASHFCEFLKSSMDELQRNEHLNQAKMIMIAESLKSKTEKLNNDQEVAESFKVAIFNSMKPFATESLIRAIKTGAKDGEAKRIDALIVYFHNSKPKFWDEILSNVLKSTYDSFEHKNILKSIASSRNIPVALAAVRALFDKIVDSGDRNKSIVWDVGQRLANVPDTDEAGNRITKEVSKYFNQIAHRLPECVMHMYFTPEVCLWNVNMKSNLLAASRPYIAKPQMRRDPSRIWLGRQRCFSKLFESNTLKAYIQVKERTKSSGVANAVYTDNYITSDEVAWDVQIADEPNYVYTAEFDHQNERKYLWQINDCR